MFLKILEGVPYLPPIWYTMVISVGQNHLRAADAYFTGTGRHHLSYRVSVLLRAKRGLMPR